MKPTVPLRFSKKWSVVTIVVELIVIGLVVLYGLKPPEIYVSSALILLGLLSGALCNYLFVVHLTQKLCEVLPTCKQMCAEVNAHKRLGSRALGLFFVILAVAFIVVWPSVKDYDDPTMRKYAAGWFLAFICSQSLWFDLTKFKYLWGSKGILRKMTASSAPAEKK